MPCEINHADHPLIGDATSFCGRFTGCDLVFAKTVKFFDAINKNCQIIGIGKQVFTELRLE